MYKTLHCLLSCFVTLAAADAPVVPAASVVNNASFATGTDPLAPGTIAAIFGSNLNDGSKDPFSSFGKNGEILTSLGGASVTFNGIPAPIFSSFSGQLNVQIPLELGSANAASVIVTVGGRSSPAQSVALGSDSPGIFSTTQSGKGQGAIQIANTTIFAAPSGSISGSQSRAVKAGEFITIFCTGLGAVTNPPGTGKAASANPLSTTLVKPKVSIGGTAATVSFSGLAPGFAGLYQVDVQIPDDAPGGNAVPLTLSIGGAESNAVTIAIAGAAPGNKIAGGEQHTCVINGAGGVLCWGKNFYGQLGNGTTTQSDTPVPVTGLSSGAISITAGSDFTCALMKAGTVQCWGYNVQGNVGNGTTVDAHVPAQVLDVAGTGPLSGIVAIGSGQYHTCAVTGAGAVLCWGDDDMGELGPEHTVFRSGLPYQVTGIPADIVAVSGGAYFECALTSKGNVWCWGTSGGGQLGAGPNLPNENPVEVLNTAGTAPLSGITGIAASFSNACAVTSSSELVCWGDNQDGEDGNNTNIANPIPVQVLDTTGKSALSGIAEASGGTGDTCALTTTGGVLCWGSPNNGDLGNQNDRFSEIPVQVSGLTTGVTQIASGYRHNCAILSDGTVTCWGFNITGQLGNGNTNDSPVPVAVLGVGGSGVLKLF